MSLHLSEEQQQIIKVSAKRLCILACAGSGKTTTLTRRIARIINEEKVDPESVAAITFTVLAADRLKYELALVLKDRSASSRMFIGTIHSFCLKLLRDGYGGSEGDNEPITDSQQFILLSKYWRQWEIDKILSSNNKTPVIEKLIETFDIIKMNQIDISSIEKNHPEIARIFLLYQEYITNTGFIDYADMLIKVKEMMCSDVNIRNNITCKYRHIFIDEYQDVDPIQDAFVELFTDVSNVCVVGDDDQAIYQFRGTDERNLQRFSTNPSCINLPLSTNRRCPSNILYLAEKSIKRVKRRLPKKMFSSIDKGFVSICKFTELKDELNFIIKIINEKIQTKEATSYGQFAVLLRSVSSYGHHYIDALRAAKIPCVSRGARTLFETEEILKVVAIMEWLAKEDDKTINIKSLEPIFSTQHDINRLLTKAEIDAELTLDDFINTGYSEQDYKLLQLLLSIKIKYTERKFGSLLELIHYFIEILKLMEPSQDITVKYNIAYLTQIISEYETIQDNKNFRTLCSYLSMYAKRTFDEVKPIEHYTDAVNILTIHQSKGLEYDYVFLPMLVEKRFPLKDNSSRWLIDDNLFDAARYRTSLDNERRLFYVACTRSRKALYLSAPQDVGLKKKKNPSIFFKENANITIPHSNEIPDRPNRELINTRFLVTGYSSLEYYLTCPYRYQLIVEFGLTFPQVVYFQFGKLIHTVFAFINNSYLQGKLLSKDEINDYFSTNFNFYYKNTNMRQYDLRSQKYRGLQIIDTYLHTKSDWLNHVAGVEKDFFYIVDNALIKGRYDALLKNERGNYSILDYKTGKPHEGLRTDFQMQFYAIAANYQLGINVDEAILYYVENDQIIIFKVTEDFLAAGTNNLQHTISGILTQNYEPTPRKGICTQCEVKQLCPSGI